ncbi:VanZ family protein [Sedimentibacter sp. B4]|uniref:VanZ family protein n=1 Tax=Sedimentibacter sp. B4 TaxID=304766 RepID=UPI000312353C|nr:VanZ family protein [Sedimentibacter sp. B4]
MNNKLRITPWLPAAVWMLVIFFLSAQPAFASNSLSRGVTKIIVETIGKVIPLDIEMSTLNDIVSQLNHFVRKFAHFSAYAVLGVLVSYALAKNKIQGKRAFALSLAICIIYAVSDELHQLLVPGRGCQLKDVIIDTSGALSGTTIYKAVNILRARH